jgi:hypothetical protein
MDVHAAVAFEARKKIPTVQLEGSPARRQQHQKLGVLTLELRLELSVREVDPGILSWEHPINISGPAPPLRFTIMVTDGSLVRQVRVGRGLTD